MIVTATMDFSPTGWTGRSECWCLHRSCSQVWGRHWPLPQVGSSFNWSLLMLFVSLHCRVRECKVVMFSGRTKGCFESPPYLDQVTDDTDRPLCRCLFLYEIWGQGWIKSRLPVVFRTDSFKTPIDSRQFQKFLLVIDSFGPNRCGKYGLKSFGILGFSPHTHLSLLYIESAMRVDDILQHCLKNIDLCFWKFW